MNALLPAAVLMACSMLWGLTWLALKRFGDYGLEGPGVTLFAHGTVGALALPLLWRRRREWWSDRRRMGLLALAGGLANVAFATAIVRGEVTRVMALFYLLPAWGVLGGKLLLGARVAARRRVSLVSALFGAFLVLGGSGLVREPPGFVDLLAVISGLALAANNILFRMAQDVSVTTKVSMSFVGCLLWAAASTAIGAADIPADVPAGIWLEVFAFGLIWILVATAGTLWGVNQMEAGRSSVLIVTELVTAVVSASILTRRVPSVGEVIGGSMILLSALLEAWRPARPALALREHAACHESGT
jgi:drug/metabolite transporter (DMT)-like permease